MKRVRLHPDVTIEARHALLWYMDKSAEAAIQFSTELRTAYRAVQAQPHAYPAYLHGTRRKILDRFPFSVVFREFPDRIEIVAVAHAKRRPGFWIDRLKSN